MNTPYQPVLTSVVRVLLWSAAFLVPALSAGFALPHGPYIVVPALAAYDGTSFRRVLLGALAMLVYETVYHIPYGALAVPVVVLAAGTALLMRSIRAEPLSAASGWSAGPLVRAVLIAALWGAGMVVLSSLWESLTVGEPFSAVALIVVWSGVPMWTLASGTLLALVLLHRSRVPFTRPIRFGQ